MDRKSNTYTVIYFRYRNFSYAAMSNHLHILLKLCMSSLIYERPMRILNTGHLYTKAQIDSAPNKGDSLDKAEQQAADYA